MKVEVKMIPDEGDDTLPENQRAACDVQTHERRGDSFSVLRNDTVVGAGVTTFEIPSGGRLVINAPKAESEHVYDRDQAAAVSRATQKSTIGVDAPVQGTIQDPTHAHTSNAPQKTAGQASAEALRGNPTTPATTNPTPTGNTQPASNVPNDSNHPQMNKPAGSPATSTPSGSRITPAPNTPDPSKSTEKK